MPEELGMSLAPKPGFLLSLANQKWRMGAAIAELFDNSFGKIRGNARRIDVTYNVKKRILTVCDDGQGMPHLGKAFRLGDSAGISPQDIGRYGCGGTMAMIWIADRVRMWTMRGDRQVMYDDIKWSEVMQATDLGEVYIGSDGWRRATVNNTPPALLQIGHGTMIELHLRKERTMVTDAVQRELAATFAPGLRKQRKIVWTTIGSRGREHEHYLSDVELERPPKDRRVRFYKVLRYEGYELPIKGEFGLYDDLSMKRSVASIGFDYRRIMTTRDCYYPHDENTEVDYSGRGVMGWIDLGHNWQYFLTTTKEDINDEPLRVVLMQYVFEQIERLLKQTEEDHMSIVLEGIALDLQDALNNLADKSFKVMVGRKRSRIGPNPDPDPEPGPDPDPNPEPRPQPLPDPGDESGDSEADQPCTSRLNLIKSSDEAMDGALCRMLIESERDASFVIEVNRDHEVIKEAIKARPINAMALNLMVTREIASGLIRNDRLLERALNISLRAKLDVSDKDDQRERILARILMDSTRWKKPADDDDDGGASNKVTTLREALKKAS